MEHILEVNNLTKSFKTRGQYDYKAVDDVTFSISKGECLGIIGESGSGKSTIANIITGLEQLTEGQIILDGQDISHMKKVKTRDIYTKVQMVFQSPVESFDPRRTLGYGIAESLINSGMSRKDANVETISLLKQCGLGPEFASRFPHEVSGGQCQRAAIARALAIKPKLLICDEATSALDVTIQQEVMQLLSELRETRGDTLSILFICHDIALVQRFCDRILVMHRGKIVEQGVPDDIISHPKEEYTKKLINSVL